MNKKYFRIVPATKADAAQLYYLLTNKTFYPEPTSVPALPASYSAGFDYRQFFKLVGIDKDGNAIVFTRTEYTVSEFNTNVIPTADWTVRYYMSVAPTVVALPTYTETLASGHSVKTDIGSFLSFDYQLYNNK